MQSLERELARRAFDKVKNYENRDRKETDLYGSMAQKLPVLILSSGLTQALAFVDDKGTSDKRKILHALLDDLASVVGRENMNLLLLASREANFQQYALLTRKSLLALEWFSRFSQSVLGVPRGEGETR